MLNVCRSGINQSDTLGLILAVEFTSRRRVETVRLVEKDLVQDRIVDDRSTLVHDEAANAHPPCNETS